MNEALVDPEVFEVPPSLGDKFEHSFVGNERANSNSEVVMPPKFTLLPGAALKKKS